MSQFEKAFSTFRKKFKKGILWIERIPPSEPKWEDFPSSLHPLLKKYLETKGIQKLFSHQRQAWELIQKGANVVIATPTASGKTLCYNLPVLDNLLKNPNARALYIFPTKALAQDQKAILREFNKIVGKDFLIETYDGDTPSDLRRTVRERGRIILTNPDMLHTGILPHHVKWAKVFENLKYIVVDELHTYRGVFGSHVALVFERLKRICSFYGTRPQFITASATLANPGEHARQLLREPVESITESGAPSGERYFVLYNPPFIDPTIGIRRSFIQESARIAGFWIEQNLQVIVFAPSRLFTEVILKYIREKHVKKLSGDAELRGYRGGYLPKLRREIETALREGRVRCVVSTNALELGVDIGSLDVSILTGYPGTLASLWQQAGRAGRRNAPAVHVFVASARPLDQYLVYSPPYIFGQSPEEARINPMNLFIFMDHLKCAAFELPFLEGEEFFGQDISEWLELLEEDGFVHHAGKRWHWIADAYPADAISLRTVSSDNFVVIDISGKPEVIAEVDFSSALTTIHPHAIYMCEAKPYHVDELDFEGRKAYVRPVQVDYFTDAIRYTHVDILDVFESESLDNREESFGEVKIQEQVVGFKKIKLFTHENVGSGELNLPEYRMHTQAFWITFHRDFYLSWAERDDIRQTMLKSLSYLFHQLAPLILMVDVRDLSTACSEGEGKGTEHKFTPRIYLYEIYPGGVGLAKGLFEKRYDLYERAFHVVSSCECNSGCPGCIGPHPVNGTFVKKALQSLLENFFASRMTQ